MRDAAAPIRGISLQQTLPEAEFIGAADLRAASCCADSRICRPGDLFVAIAGEHADGHAYVRQAAEQGAAAVLTDRPLPPDCLLPGLLRARRPSRLRPRLSGLGRTSRTTFARGRHHRH